MARQCFPQDERLLAGFSRFGNNLLDSTTDACTDELTGARAYPRELAVYTIRTPSPQGQRGTPPPTLPIFLRWLLNAQPRTHAKDDTQTARCTGTLQSNWRGPQKQFARNLKRRPCSDLDEIRQGHEMPLTQGVTH